MNLRADHHGFLIPDRAFAAFDANLANIASDVSHILRLLEGAQAEQRIAARRQVRRMQTMAHAVVQTLPHAVVQTLPHTLPQARQNSAPQIKRQESAHQAAGQARRPIPRQPFPAASAQPVITQSGSKLAAARMTQAAQRASVDAGRTASAPGQAGPSHPPARDQRGRFVRSAQGTGAADDVDQTQPNAAREHATRERLHHVLSKLAHLPALSGDAGQLDPGLDAMLEIKQVLAGPMKLMGDAGGALLALPALSRRKKAENQAQAQAQVATPWHRRMLKSLSQFRSKKGSAFEEAQSRQRSTQPGANRLRTGTSANSVNGENSIILSAIKMLLSPLGAMAAGALSSLLYAAREQVSDALSTSMQALTRTWDNLALWGKEKLDTALQSAKGLATQVANSAGRAAASIAQPLVQGAHKAAHAANIANTAIQNATGVDVKAGVHTLASGAGQIATRVQAAGGSLLEKILPQGYRHQALFDGIAGGAGLSKYGRYTDAESEQIRSLKTSGANTSAKLKGGMPAAIQQKIIEQARAAGLNPEMMLQIAALESGGNAHAISPTGAIGIYQFTGQTASGIGIKDRFNAAQNIAGGMKLTQQNLQALQAAKLPVNTTNLYMMHQLGPVVAQEIIRGAQQGKAISSLSATTQKAVSLNVGANAKTAQEYLDINQAALRKRAEEAIGKSQAGFLPTGSVVKSMPPAAPAAPATMSIPQPAEEMKSGARPAPVATASTPAAAVLSPATMPALAPSMAAAAHITAPPTIKPPPPIAPPPVPPVEVPARLNRTSPVEVIVRNEQEVAQDVPDRRLAAIASGGISQA